MSTPAATQRKPIPGSDRKPSFLDAMGIGPGEYLFNSKAQIAGLNRKGHGELYRIWAVLDLASMGYKSPVAVKYVPLKKLKRSMQVTSKYQKRENDGSVTEYALVPLSPTDIAQATGIEKGNVKRGLRELERMGHIQCEGKTANHIRIQFLARPEKIKEKRVVKLDPSLPSVRHSSLKEVTIRFTARARKRYFPKLSGNLELNPEGVVNSDYLTGAEDVIGDLWLWADPLIKAEWARRREDLDRKFGFPTEQAQTNGSRGHHPTDPEAVSFDNSLGVKSNGAYKEERKPERKQVKAQYSTEGSGRSVVPENPPAPPASLPSDQTPPITETRTFLQKFSKLLGKVPDPAIVRSVAEARGESSIEQMIALVRTRLGTGLKIKSFGLFIDLAKECARTCEEWNQAPEGIALTAAAGAGISKNARVIQMYIEQELKERKLK